MSEIRQATASTIVRGDLRLGELLAEGGEGRVFALPLQPHLVFKEYQHPLPRGHLSDLVAWPRAGDPALVKRVEASASWPAAVVAGTGDTAAGVVMPRAPRRFALRHRDGATRLANLSYLTADPAYREVAYGIGLPPAFSPERLGIVYALARLLEAFEKLDPPVGHGDLSARNVLWSLQRGPEVFVIDCDNCERFGTDGAPLSHEGRRRAMTPNWDDPAVAPGGNPGIEADRYSLALIFLRVAGAANFPVQPRQRQGKSITIDFPVPRGYSSEVLLGPAAPLWDLCAGGLGISAPTARPPASTWVAELEAVLDAVGAAHLMRAVWAAQGGGPAPGHRSRPPSAPGDVTIRPVLAPPRPAAPRRVVPAAVSSARTTARTPAWAPGPAFARSPRPVPAAPSPAAGAQIRSAVATGLRWWFATHSALLDNRAPARRRRSRLSQLVLCAAVDVGVAAVALFVTAMAVAPVLGI